MTGTACGCAERMLSAPYNKEYACNRCGAVYKMVRVDPPAAPIESDADSLHLAICQAVHLMNQGDLHAGHDLLRQTLIDFADKKAPLSRSEIVQQQQLSGSGEVTAVMVSPKEETPYCNPCQSYHPASQPCFDVATGPRFAAPPVPDEAEVSHHKHCSIWTVTTDGNRNSCDCVCVCEHTMFEHIRPGEHAWYEDCAVDGCPCVKFAVVHAPADEADKALARELDERLNHAPLTEWPTIFAEFRAQARKEAAQQTWRDAAQKLRDKAEDWRQQGERWQKSAESAWMDIIRDQDYADRDACFFKMAAAITLAIEFDAAALESASKQER